MENIKTKEWQQVVDSAEESNLTRDLPAEYPLGGHYYEEVPNALSRDWQRLLIVSGKAGARWAYWVAHGTKDSVDYRIVVDTIFNGDASHFVGMLGLPFSGIFPGQDVQAWVLISPRMVPPPEAKLYEEKPKERYERSKEIYDVETGETRRLPGHT